MADESEKASAKDEGSSDKDESTATNSESTAAKDDGSSTNEGSSKKGDEVSARGLKLANGFLWFVAHDAVDVSAPTRLLDACATVARPNDEALRPLFHA